MQLTPKTAANVAKSLKIQRSLSKLTQGSLYNIMLGGKHLKDLYQKYNDSILTIAAYNAGAIMLNLGYQFIEISTMLKAAMKL